MKTITIMAFRKSPGEVFHEVYKHGETFIITKAGKPICELKPLESTEAIRIGTAIRSMGLIKDTG